MVLVVAAFFSVLAAALGGGVLWFLSRMRHALPDLVAKPLEAQHREMLSGLHEALARQSERTGVALADSHERLRAGLVSETAQMRASLHALEVSQGQGLSAARESMSQKIAELSATLQAKQDALRTEMLATVLESLAAQGRANQELIGTTLRNMAQVLGASLEQTTKAVDGRLEQIAGRVNERLDEGFKKTNETFANVMARLATIDEAQKKIDGLTSNVVSLQELLGDKRSRGAFGEVQLESLVRNILPPSAYALQHTLSNGTRADCALFLPEPTGLVAVDSKFPLENYHRMFGSDAGDRAKAERQFKLDVKKHVDDIAQKYIIAHETSDGAVMFVPAEAIFAEIHGHHPEVVDYAMQRRVWIVSPTTMMAVLNTARAVLKDVETRRQVHIIKESLAKLGQEFARFDVRMKKLADHIRMAHQDAEDVQVTSQKITRRFAQIESVELERPEEGFLAVAGPDD